VKATDWGPRDVNVYPHSVGWPQTSDETTIPLEERARFVTIRRSAMGTYKVVSAYPLTNDGWRQACQELAALEPSAMPLALAPGVLRKSKAAAFLIFPNGKIHEKKLDGTAAIRAAQRDAVRFNTPAGPAEAPAPEPAQPSQLLSRHANGWPK